jgi:hypothetical protein
MPAHIEVVRTLGKALQSCCDVMEDIVSGFYHSIARSNAAMNFVTFLFPLSLFPFLLMIQRGTRPFVNLERLNTQNTVAE